MFSFFTIKSRVGILLLLVLDLAGLLLIFHASVLLRAYVFPLVLPNLPQYTYELKAYGWMFLVWLAVMIYEGGYSRRFALWDEIKFVWRSAFFSTLAILTMLFMMKRGQDYSRFLIGIIFVVGALLLPFTRPYSKKLLYRLGLLKRKILIAGSGQAAVKARDAILNEPNLGYEVAGFIDDNGAREVTGVKVYSGLEHIERYIKSAGIHDIVIAKPELAKEDLIRLINAIQHKAQNTLFIPDISGIAVAGTELRHFFREQTLMIEVKNNLANPLNYAVKRSIDYCAGLAVFALSLPLIALIAHLVRRGSPGPAFLKQRRIGRNGKTFQCYKFRTMHVDAEERLKAILNNDPKAKEEWEKFWKLKDDPRITKTGAWLRATSLDELPQVLNILKGQMSLIGPRPYLPREKEFLAAEGETILKLPPGITGLWQISGRSNTSYDFRITMDSWYVKNWDLWLDVMIIFKTIGVVLKREGAR